LSLSITKESIGKIVKTNNNHICKIHTTSRNGVHGKKQMLLILKCYSYIEYVYFKQDSNSFQTTFIATLSFFFINILFYVGAKSRRGGKEKPDLVFVVACCECQWNQKPVLDVYYYNCCCLQSSKTQSLVDPCCLNLNIFQKCFSFKFVFPFLRMDDLQLLSFLK